MLLEECRAGDQFAGQTGPDYKGRSMLAGVLLSLLPALAHAEGNHDLHGVLAMFVFLLLAAVIMLGQGIYLLCLRNVAGKLKFLLLIALAAFDLFTVRLLFPVFDSSDFMADFPFLVLLLVIPGFVFVYFVQKRFNRVPESGSRISN